MFFRPVNTMSVADILEKLDDQAAPAWSYLNVAGVSVNGVPITPTTGSDNTLAYFNSSGSLHSNTALSATSNGVITITPVGYSQPFWGTTGCLGAWNGTVTINDSTSSGTINGYTSLYSFAPASISATSAVTYNYTATVYIGGPPVASTNVTQINPYSLYVRQGSCYLGTGASTLLNILDDGAGDLLVYNGLTLANGPVSAEAWSNNGVVIAQGNGGTVTDTTSTGSVSGITSLHTLGQYSLVASAGATTYANVASLYVKTFNASTNVTITNKWGIWVASNPCLFQAVTIGGGGSGTSGFQLTGATSASALTVMAGRISVVIGGTTYYIPYYSS